jgi:hypothetical protein
MDDYAITEGKEREPNDGTLSIRCVDNLLQ